MRLNHIALLLASTLFASSPLRAQQPGPVTLVMPDGEGRLIAPFSPTFVPTAYKLEDGGYRTTIVFADNRHEITLAASIFPNDDGTPEACRDMALTALLPTLQAQATVRNQSYSLRQAPNGTLLAATSFQLVATGLDPRNQQNIFAFAAGPHTCAELHLTKSSYTPADAPLLNAEMDHMRFDPTYQPTSQDYTTLGGYFFETTRDYRAAAAFYRRALDTLPATTDTRNTRRSLTDQLSMSYAVYGDVKSSYVVNEEAIALDPTYPYYYYNLACVDAELHNPLDARRHLEAAFSRRNNALPGDPLPDPAHDTSLQKIAYDKSFWAYVQSLSRSLPY